MRILVVGAGSTGGYFGGRLAQTGRDVTFLVRPARAAQIRANSLQIVSPHGDVTLAPTLVTAADITGPYDAVLLTVKGYALDAALADLAPAIGPDTMILPVLNGMKHMDSLAARFGAQTVVGCACKIAAFVDDAGRIVQLARFQELVYGEMDGTATPRMQHLDETLQGAGFTARLSATVAQEMWEKWTLLATMGGICCLMRGNTGEIASVPGGAEFSTHFLDEVVRIVSAVGVAPREAFVSSTRTALADKTSQQNTSMYRDLTQGRPVEAEQIIGDLLARGQAAGIAAPLLAAAFAHLSVYQARLAA